MAFNPDSYYVVHGWMSKELHLKGNELHTFAIIYGYSQDGKSVFSGSISYIMDALNLSKRNTIRILESLVNCGLVRKSKEMINCIEYNRYAVNLQAVQIIRHNTRQVLAEKSTLGGDKMSLDPVTKCHLGGDKMSLDPVTKCHLGGDKMSPQYLNNTIASIKEGENKKNSDEFFPSPKQEKQFYGKYKNCRLTESEYQQLKKDFGSEIAEDYIQRLDTFIDKKGNHSKNHNATIRKWISQDKPKKAKKENSVSKYECVINKF